MEYVWGGGGDRQMRGPQSRMLILHYKINSGLGSAPEAAMEPTGKVPALEGAFQWRKEPRAPGGPYPLGLCLAAEGTLGAQAPDMWFSHGVGVGDRRATQGTFKRGGWGGAPSLTVNSHDHQILPDSNLVS